jgi:glycosyltransferase involved in cell wall biosynthesis
MFSPTIRLHDAEMHIRLIDDFVDLSEVTTAELRLIPPSNGSLAGYFLVIDIYGSSGSHPDGHIGWWTVELAKLGSGDADQICCIPLRRDEERVVVDAARMPPIRDSWENKAYRGTGNPKLHVVLRRVSNGAVVFDQIMEVLLTADSRDEMQAYRRSLTGELTRPVTAAPVWFSWPAASAVRLAVLDFAPLEPVSAFVLDCCCFLRAQGIEAHIYADRFDHRFRGAIRDLSGMAEETDERDIVVVNYACYDPYLTKVAALDCGKILFFHGLVPPRSLEVYDAELARYLAGSMKQANLFRQFDVMLAGWKTIARGLFESFGFDGDDMSEWETRPPLMDCAPVLGVDRWDEIEATGGGFDAASPGLLYVGVLAPHAGIDRVLKLFDALVRLRPDARLVIAAREVMPAYATYVDYLIANKLDPRAAERVELVVKPSWPRLKALYRTASAFVSCARYEPAGADLIDAMAFDLPIFAVTEPTIKEVLGRAALYFTDAEDAAAAAQFVARTLDNSALLKAFARRQARRRQDLDARLDGSEFCEALLAALGMRDVRLKKLRRGPQMTRAAAAGIAAALPKSPTAR